jgi:hypothetical protein
LSSALITDSVGKLVYPVKRYDTKIGFPELIEYPI